MKIQEIAGRRVKVSRSTISVLNDDGKTAGMITGVDTFYNMPPREQFEHADKLRRLGIDRLKMDWRRMFFVKGVWYYLADDGALAWAHKFREIDGDKPIARLEEARQAAEQFGAEIIHVARITDTRK